MAADAAEHFGQSGDLTDLHRVYRIDDDAILDAVAAACLAALQRT
jgi:pyruvate dehydrogenase E1 component